MEALGGLHVKPFSSSQDWERWLEVNHAQTQGVWVKIAKKASGMASVSYGQALDAALCYGWIDGQKQSFDASYYLQKFTPRRSKSIWSKVNVQKVAALTAAGRMKPAGLAAVNTAKQDGRWDQAYDSHRTMTMPLDFQATLEKHPKAKTFFATLNKTNTYAILWRIQTAKKPETRLARIEKSIAMLNEGKKFHP